MSDSLSDAGGDVDDASGDQEGLTIDQVSRLLDVPAPTLRSWERRHGVPVVSRTSGGHRRYTPSQVDMLRQLRDLVAQGRRPVDAAVEVRARSTSSASLVEAFLEAARGLEPGAIAETLDNAQRALGLGRVVDEVLLPGMRRIGEWWENGQEDIAHEHLATNTAQAWLSGVASTGPTPLHTLPIVLACGPRDHHTLGLEAIGALLRSRGQDCRLLGARTPGDSLVRAVQETAAAAVVMVSHVPAGRLAAVEALRSPELRHASIFFAGGAFATPQARRGVPGHYLGTNFSRATQLIIATLDSYEGPARP